MEGWSALGAGADPGTLADDGFERTYLSVEAVQHCCDSGPGRMPDVVPEEFRDWLSDILLALLSMSAHAEGGSVRTLCGLLRALAGAALQRLLGRA